MRDMKDIQKYEDREPELGQTAHPAIQCHPSFLHSRCGQAGLRALSPRTQSSPYTALTPPLSLDLSDLKVNTLGVGFSLYFHTTRVGT